MADNPEIYWAGLIFFSLLPLFVSHQPRKFLNLFSIPTLEGNTSARVK
jgi:hypothetical protein